MEVDEKIVSELTLEDFKPGTFLYFIAKISIPAAVSVGERYDREVVSIPDIDIILSKARKRLRKKEKQGSSPLAKT